MQTDVLIIGCGIGGAAAALELARDRERDIVVLSRSRQTDESNSSWAQGGIVGRGTDDGPEALFDDIRVAGAGLSYPPAVRRLAEDGPDLLLRPVHESCVNVGVSHVERQGERTVGLFGEKSKELGIGRDATGAGLRFGTITEAAAGGYPMAFPHRSRDEWWGHWTSQF